MSPREAIAKVTTPTFLGEIHHLLWVEPGDNQGTWDEGWNCRDHALIAGIVCQLLKLTASVIYGEATFVQGPDGLNPPVGLCQSTHAWLGIDGLGFMDLSPNLLRCRSEAWRPWDLQCIALSKCLPSGTFACATSQGDYEFRVNAASNSLGCNAIYFGQGVDHIDSDLVEKCFEVVNSPMTVRLSAKFDATIYPRAAIHLFKLVRGESKSLVHLSQDDAWEAISRQPGNPLSWLKMRGGIR